MGLQQVCQSCRGGVPRGAAKAWRLQLRGADEHHQKRSRGGGAHTHLIVQVGLPTEIPMAARLRASYVTGGEGHGLEVESADQGLTRELLADPAVDRALSAAVAVMGQGSLTLDPIGVNLDAQASAFDAEDLDAIDRAALSLAVAIERWVRGDPRGVPTREGCVDRPEQRAEGVDPGVPREVPVAWISPESFYREKVPPGPPCPSCGEPTTNAITEYVCTQCGQVIDRPEVRERLGKRALRQRLIVIGIVVVLLAGLLAAILLEQG